MVLQEGLFQGSLVSFGSSQAPRTPPTPPLLQCEEKNPEDMKFRKIKMENPVFLNKIAKAQGGTEAIPRAEGLHACHPSSGLISYFSVCHPSSSTSSEIGKDFVVWRVVQR